MGGARSHDGSDYPALAAFDAAARSALMRQLALLEPARKRIAVQGMWIVAGSLAAAIGAAWLTTRMFATPGIGAVPAVLVGVAGLVALSWRLDGASKHIDNAQVDAVATRLGLSHTADPVGNRDLSVFRDYGLVPEYTEIALGRVIDGTHNDIGFSMCEVYLARPHHDFNGNSRVFRGLLFRLEMQTDFGGPLVGVRMRGFVRGRRRPFGDARLVSGMTDNPQHRFKFWTRHRCAVPQVDAQGLAQILARLDTRYGGKPMRVALVRKRIYLAVDKAGWFGSLAVFRTALRDAPVNRVLARFADMLTTVDVFASAVSVLHGGQEDRRDA